MLRCELRKTCVGCRLPANDDLVSQTLGSTTVLCWVVIHNSSGQVQLNIAIANTMTSVPTVRTKTFLSKHCNVLTSAVDDLASSVALMKKQTLDDGDV